MTTTIQIAAPGHAPQEASFTGGSAGRWSSPNQDVADALNLTLPAGGFSADQRMPSRAAAELAQATYAPYVKVISIAVDENEGEDPVEE